MGPSILWSFMLNPVHLLLMKPDPDPCCQGPKNSLLNIPTLPSSEPQAKIQAQERVPGPRSHCWKEPELLTSSLTSAGKSLPPSQLSHLHAPFLCLYYSLHFTCPSHLPSCCPTLKCHGKWQPFHGPSLILLTYPPLSFHITTDLPWGP